MSRAQKSAMLLASEVALAIAVCLTAFAVFSNSRAKVDGDEAEWIGTSRFFVTFFAERDFSADAWPDSYWTRTQPMIARYIIGGWLSVRGHDLTRLNPAYNHDMNWSTNQRAGRAPSNALLDDARLPMRGLAALSTLLVYLIVRVIAGPVGGLVAAGLFLGSPYLTEHLIRAKGDTVLTFFLLAALLAAVLAIRRPGAPRLPWGVLAGVFLGLALGSKLTAVLGVAAVGAWGLVATFGIGRACSARAEGEARPEGEARLAPTSGWRQSALTWSATVLAITGIVFVLSNPFLYTDPIGRTLLLFQNRQDEMAVQAATEPYRVIPTPDARVFRVWERSLLHETWGSSYLGWPAEAVLAVAGAVVLLLRAARRPASPEGLLLFWAAAFFGGVTWGLGYLQQHYFVPTTIVGVVLAGVGAGWLWRTAADRMWIGGVRFPALARLRRERAPLSAPLTADG